MLCCHEFFDFKVSYISLSQKRVQFMTKKKIKSFIWKVLNQSIKVVPEVFATNPTRYVER